VVQLADGAEAGQRHWYRADQGCHLCDYRAPDEVHPRWFSFNHHSAACPSCLGLGEVVVCAEDLLVNRPDKPVFGGAIRHQGAAFTFLTNREGWYAEVAAAVAERHDFDLSLPWKKLPARARQILLRGCG